MTAAISDAFEATHAVGNRGYAVVNERDHVMCEIDPNGRLCRVKANDLLT
jgi:hypothetical protein